MLNYTGASVRRKIEEARNAAGMRVGLPKAIIDCALLESLCRIAENAETLCAELDRLKREFICRKCGMRKDGEHAPVEF
jgi:hypothetical protein